MKLADQIGRREMNLPVGGVGRSRDRCSVGRPHRRGAGGGGEQTRIRAMSGVENMPVIAGESHSSQHLDVGPIVRRKDRLGNAHVGE